MALSVALVMLLVLHAMDHQAPVVLYALKIKLYLALEHVALVALAFIFWIALRLVSHARHFVMIAHQTSVPVAVFVPQEPICPPWAHVKFFYQHANPRHLSCNKQLKYHHLSAPHVQAIVLTVKQRWGQLALSVQKPFSFLGMVRVRHCSRPAPLPIERPKWQLSQKCSYVQLAL